MDHQSSIAIILPRVLCLLIYALFPLLVFNIQSCHGFASMFVDQKASCWLDLRDTESEVIMNNLIKSPDQSPHGYDVTIDVYDAETMRLIQTTIDEEQEGHGKRIVYIDNNDNVEVGHDVNVIRTFLLKLRISKDHPDLADLQYVMDAKVLPEFEDESAAAEAADKGTRMTAEFPRRSGCNKARSYGRKGDNGLELKVIIPALLFSEHEKSNQQPAVDVVAGWACGHEAVTLTQAIEFRPWIKKSGSNNKIMLTSADIESVKDEVKLQEELQQEQEHFDLQDMKDILHGGGVTGGLRSKHKREIIQQIHERKKQYDIEEEENGQHHYHHHHHLNLKKFNHLYENHRFGLGSFNGNSHVKGILVVAFLGFIVMKYFFSNGKKSKGRRDL